MASVDGGERGGGLAVNKWRNGGGGGGGGGGGVGVRA